MGDREDVDKYLVRLGFKEDRLSYMGNLDTPCHLEWHERDEGRGHQYLAIWT